MNACSPKPHSQCRSNACGTRHCAISALVVGMLVAILFPVTAGAHPQTREGFYLGLGFGQGSMTESYNGGSLDAVSGSGGSFRLGWVVNPRLGLGLESNSWVTLDEYGGAAVGTSTFAVSVFPAEGLVLRGGVGAGYSGGAGGGVSGDTGFGWTAGAAYEFRVMRTFAIGPQIDYSRASFT